MISKKIGLRNLGNTCYMNSVLQCLYHTKFKEKLMKDIYGGSLVKILKNLFIQLEGANQHNNISMFIYTIPKDLRKDEQILINSNDLKSYTKHSSLQYKNAVNPSELKNYIDRKINKFYGYDTHDCADFFVNLLNLFEKGTKLANLFLIEMKIVSQISHIKEYSAISCFGQTKKKYKTPPNALTDEDKSFFLDIPSTSFKSDLKSCILEYLKPKKLSGNVQGTEFKDFLDLPEILVINLRRINKDYYYHQFIQYPKEIDLTELIEKKNISRFNYTINGFKNLKEQKYNYQLKAFIIHRGHPQAGHKITICYDEKDCEWYSFDDSDGDFCHNPFNQEVAFLFFYEKIN